MIRYTLGPWRHRNGTVFSGPVNRPLTIAKVARAHDGDYSSGNGDLIAAAPELLAALEAFRAVGGTDFDGWATAYNDAVEMARAAIKKARGE